MTTTTEMIDAVVRASMLRKPSYDVLREVFALIPSDMTVKIRKGWLVLSAQAFIMRDVLGPYARRSTDIFIACYRKIDPFVASDANAAYTPDTFYGVHVPVPLALLVDQDGDRFRRWTENVGATIDSYADTLRDSNDADR